MTYAAPTASVFAAPPQQQIEHVAPAQRGQTRQSKIPTTTMKGGPSSVQDFQPSFTQERVQGAPVMVAAPPVQVEGAPVVVGQTPMETIVAGQVSQNIVEIPTVSEQVNEVIVPEISNVETIVEVPQVVQKTVERIVEQVIEVPKIQIQKQVVQRTVEQIQNVPVPQTVERVVEVVKIVP